MHFSHISIGGGITGLETIISAFNYIKNDLVNSKIKRKKFKFKKFTFAIIEKKPENIPGGVAYGFINSKYGFFNNPIRLSPKKFIDWLLKRQNKKKIVEYLKKHGGYTGKKWLNNYNKVLFSPNLKKFRELYIPRAVFNFWMEERLISLISEMKLISKKLSIFFEIRFYKGEVIAIKEYQKKTGKMILKNNFCEELNYKIVKHPLKKLIFKNSGKRKKSIFSMTQNIGLGLPPPKQLASAKAQKINNYIWDFYSEGSTVTLIKKLSNLYKKKEIKIYFIGYKAGLLESLPEIKEVILRKKINIKLICSSKNLESMQSAKLSLDKKKYKLEILISKNLSKIKSAKKLYFSILKEFETAIKTGYKKYDAWTQILEHNILSKCIKNLNPREKRKYFDSYHRKIRNITRYTYPETIAAREQLLDMGILKTRKEVVNKIDVDKKKLIIKAKNEKNEKITDSYDIVVNVSGPLNPRTILNEIPLVKSLKNKGAKTTRSGGFLVNENFKIKGIKNIYTPGIFARGFNPERKTIIRAILENSYKAGQAIAKTLLYI